MADIYKITNLVNGKCYIGETTQFKRRITQHFSDLRSNSHVNLKLQHAFNKYGEENFKVEILFSCPDEERYQREIETIAKYDSFDHGYNLTPGGDGPGGHHMTGENNPMYGKSGVLSPAFKGYIYKIDVNGNIVGIYESSCQIAEEITGEHVKRGATNAHGICARILGCCNGWSEKTKFKGKNHFTTFGHQWIREQHYNALIAAGYDFSKPRSSAHPCPLTELGLDT